MSSSSRKMLQAAAGSAGGAPFYDYTIDNSVRLDGGSYMYRTFGTSTNQYKYTLSFWTKITKGSGDVGTVLSAGNETGYARGRYLAYNSQFAFQWDGPPPPTYQYNRFVRVNAFQRDVSSWYHIVASVDISNATSSNRVKFYINGELQSLSDTNYPTQNQNCDINQNSQVHNLFRTLSNGGINYTTNYFADVAFVDGQQLDATSFGETKNGVWIPKDLSSGITWGNNGFYLKFGNSGALGTDSSGNGNNWTTSGLTSSDQMLDTPTNNFNTVNPLYVSTSVPQPTPSDGNLRIASTITNTRLSPTTFKLPSSGKYYWEIYIDGTPNSSNYIGISGTKDFEQYHNAQYPGQYSGLGHQISGTSSQSDGSWITYGVAQSSGNIYQVAVDMDTGKVWLGNNNTWFSSGDPANGTNPGKTLTDLNVIASFATYSTGAKYDLNFGQNGTFNGKVTAQGNADANGVGNFYYSPPTGFLALCTANFPEPAIGPNSTTTSDENFNTVLWTGDGTNNRAITGVGFQPDFTWVKGRSAAEWHVLYDAVRGANKALYSNDTYQEQTTTDTFESFDTDGFTVSYNSAYSSVFTNKSGTTYVGWNWKANGSGVSNTDGSITSTVSANTDAGISIITYTGSSSGISVGHGLSSAPEMIIWKARGTPNGSARYWIVWTKDLTSTDYILYLNATNGQANVTAGSVLSSSPTATTFSLGTEPSVNWNAENYVAYCFHSVEGFSKFGKYTGNGSADGPFIFTGFRPAFVVVKAVNYTADWFTSVDSDRYNAVDNFLLLNSSGAENSSYQWIDYLSNGFKLRNTGSSLNGSGYTYIYMAFAENPFKYSNAR